MKEFAHLHVHSHYSLLDGAIKIDDLIRKVKMEKMEAVALTDHGNMFGAVEFYQKAIKAGIKPIIGMEAYIAPQSRFNKDSKKSISDAYYHLVLLVKNQEGYKNLIKLSTLGYLEGFHYRPRIDTEILKKYAEGLIGLSACIKGEIPNLILNNKYDEAKKKAIEYTEIFNGDFYLELQDHGMEEEKRSVEKVLQINKETGIPLVATNDAHYMKREDAKAHEILLCMKTGTDLSDPGRMKFSTDELYLKTPKEMKSLFNEYPEAVENTVLIAEKCNLLLDFTRQHLPDYPIPETESSKDLNEYLSKVVYENLRQIKGDVLPNYEERLKYELSVVKKMGFAGYFLIVKDFIDFAKQRNIPVGLGRGSAAGSLVSHCLGITNIDPIEYNLLFERFLNPERVTMPDIDIDFCDERRNEIIEYVTEKYGSENVTQIITFGSMNAKGVVRDVGRVMGLSYGEVDKIAKLIPGTLGITLERALKVSSELKEHIDSNEKYGELIQYAKVLEGLARHTSIHAAGIVITPTPLTNYLPLYKSPQSNDVTTQYTMKYVEEIGLLKMDFLGLRTLSVIDNTLKSLKEKDIEININEIPLDDKKTFGLFSRGETIGVFQFESSGMREYLKKLKPEGIEDLIAMNALYRPGPLGSGMVDDFIQRKHGKKKVEYLHPMLEPILKETYGVVVYQEQVMRIASDLGGFSLGDADLLRRAMGKKLVDEMRAQNEEFLKGTSKNKIPEKVAEEIFDLMDKFAGYGFNKSHSTGYGLIAYQTAYLKVHYPAEFMANTLSTEMDKIERIVTLIEECKRMNIQLYPPDVNRSVEKFVAQNEGISFGLGAIKNVGKSAIESIISARETIGNFKTIFDFLENVDLRAVNKKVMESLIQSGATDSLEGTRAQKITGLEVANSYAQTKQSEKEKGQTNIFDMGGETTEVEMNGMIQLPKVVEWSKFESLAKEKEFLGFYLSGHPLLKYEDEVQCLSTVPLDLIKSLKDKTSIQIGGIITTIKTHITKKNDVMAFITLEDFSGNVELIAFADTYEKYKDLISNDSMVFIKGTISTKDDENPKIICNEILPLDEVGEKIAKKLIVSLELNNIKESILRSVDELISEHKGEKELYLEIKGNVGEILTLKSKKYTVSLNKELLISLKEILGKENVMIK